MRLILLTTSIVYFLNISQAALSSEYVYIGQNGSYINADNSLNGKIITNQNKHSAEQYNPIYNTGRGSILNKYNLNFQAILHQNTADTGGAIYQLGKTLTLNAGSELVANTAKKDGGAIYLFSPDSGLIANATNFINNHSGRLGGAIFVNHQKSIVTINGHSNFLNNVAVKNGGAIFTVGTINLNAGTGNIVFKGNQVGNIFNDIATQSGTKDEAIINITGNHMVEINGGINNVLQNKNSTINIGNKTSGGNLNIKTSEIYADQINFNGNSNLYLTIKNSSLNPSLDYGRMYANNINFYNSNNNLVINVDINTYNGANTQTIKAIEGNFNGNFDNISSENLSDSDKYTIVSSGNDGEFIFRKNANSSENDNNHSPTQPGSNISNAWLESGTFDEGSNAYTVATHILNLSTPEREAALKALAPNNGQTMQAVTSQINNQVISSVSSQLSGGAVSVSEGRSAGDNLFERIRTWVKILTNKAKLSGSNGFSSDAQGVSFGFDKLINENTRLGLGYAHTTGDIDGFMRTTNLQSHTAILYAEYKPSHWYLNTIATYGWANYKENKNLSGMSIHSKYNINTASLQIMTGYDFGLLTPETGLRYTNYNHSAYKDSADQHSSSYNSDLLTAVVGLKIKKSFTTLNQVNITPEVKIAATYDLTSASDAALITVANGATYQTAASRLNRFGIEVGSGLNIDINNDVETSLGYEGRFRQDYQDHTAILKLKYKF